MKEREAEAACRNPNLRAGASSAGGLSGQPDRRKSRVKTAMVLESSLTSLALRTPMYMWWRKSFWAINNFAKKKKKSRIVNYLSEPWAIELNAGVNGGTKEMMGAGSRRPEGR